METLPSLSATLWWNLEKTGSNLEESYDCNLEQPKPHREVLSTTKCIAGKRLNARPLTAVSDDPEDLTALTPKQFLLGRENASAPLMPSS